MNGLGNRGREPSTILRKIFCFNLWHKVRAMSYGPVIKCSVFLLTNEAYKTKFRNFFALWSKKIGELVFMWSLACINDDKIYIQFVLRKIICKSRRGHEEDFTWHSLRFLFLIFFLNKNSTHQYYHKESIMAIKWKMQFLNFFHLILSGFSFCLLC